MSRTPEANEYLDALSELVDAAQDIVIDYSLQAHNRYMYAIDYSLQAHNRYMYAIDAATALLARPEPVVTNLQRSDRSPSGVQLIFGSEPAAAEKAREPDIHDMAMLIRQLCHRLNSVVHQPAITYRAMNYLKRHGLEGSVLRDLPSPPAATGED